MYFKYIRGASSSYSFSFPKQKLFSRAIYSPNISYKYKNENEHHVGKTEKEANINTENIIGQMALQASFKGHKSHKTAIKQNITN